MANDLTWERVGLLFPEGIKHYYADKGLEGEELDKAYPKKPEFLDGVVNFRFANSYGIQIFMNQKIPSWLGEDISKMKEVEKVYKNLSEKAYNEVLEGLKSSYEVLENWRPFVQRYVKGKGWVGHLQDHLDIWNENGVSVGDYYYLVPGGEGGSPTDILAKINDLPEHSLNDVWKRYYDMSQNVVFSEKERCCNKISGATFAECMKYTDEIYKVASELKELEF